MSKLTKEEREFLIKFYKDKIQRHEKIVKGYKIALKDIKEI